METIQTTNPTGKLASLEEVSAAIQQGLCLSIAGDEALLRL